ncbi:aminotransferase class V-fold PLP-dependent enzyme [Duganella sp. sic0402]|uniref:aminotransferase class V-fold PLP-dependent enzyme n=1 Tax=Duganella sp. sic0402 TaxID=2854786 RepID=UPI001C44DE4F|nr:aminotransferase class V-fold PLP-dependent enzyme [Duganella sp. sic0402]MBV7538082.1 aminotransferase class V-fold PLP-dependent enzyme [Duganella sp. sic0402]
MSAADPQRRTWLKAGALLPLAPSVALAASASTLPAMPARPAGTPQEVAADESYWRQIAAQYDITNEVTMLDNAFWGSMSRPVLAAYERHVAEVNRGNSYYGRTTFPPAYHAARRRAAQSLGVAEDEIVFTRGATEALQILISGYNQLKPGDVVLCADIDYDNMITTLHWLKQRRGVEVVSIAMPEPATYQAVIDCYAQAMARYPKLKMMLLTHVNHRNGMVLPVAEISRMARERGIDAIVDTAHGFGQLDMRIPDLQADFAGINLHKWIGAPIGVGAIYIRRGRVQDIDPYMGEKDRGDIRTRVHTGTINFAAYLALPLALDLHEQIGVAYKQARLARLRKRWLDAVRDLPRLELLASDDPRLSSAIASFRLRGRGAMADNVVLARRLLKEHGVFTVERDGLAAGACVRATPSIFTMEAEVDRLSAALRSVAA